MKAAGIYLLNTMDKSAAKSGSRIAPSLSIVEASQPPPRRDDCFCPFLSNRPQMMLAGLLSFFYLHQGQRV